MPIIARWNGHKFEISPSVIRGFTDLQVKGSCETEEKTSGGEKYVKRKNTQPFELSLTAHLNSFVGCDVRKEAIDLVIEARWGKSDYFYVYETHTTTGFNNFRTSSTMIAKIIEIKLMLTSATVTKVVVAPSGEWIAADVQLTLKACAVSDGNSVNKTPGVGTGGGSGGGSGYTKTSVKSTTTTTTTPTPESARARGLAYSADIRDDRARTQQRKVDQANRAIAKAKQNATAATVAKKANTAQKSTGGGIRSQTTAARV